jgi:hypothetical protein
MLHNRAKFLVEYDFSISILVVLLHDHPKPLTGTHLLQFFFFELFSSLKFKCLVSHSNLQMGLESRDCCPCFDNWVSIELLFCHYMNLSKLPKFVLLDFGANLS